MASPTTSTTPTAWNKREVNSASAAFASDPKHIAEAPWPILAGVFGITRMIRQPLPMDASMLVRRAILVPAATDTTRVLGFNPPLILSITDDIM